MPTPTATVQIRAALTSHVDALLHRARPILAAASMDDRHKGPRHPYVRLVNREAERLLRLLRAAVKEQVRALPGRAQKGAVDAAMRSVTPKVKKAARR